MCTVYIGVQNTHTHTQHKIKTLAVDPQPISPASKVY